LFASISRSALTSPSPWIAEPREHRVGGNAESRTGAPYVPPVRTAAPRDNAHSNSSSESESENDRISLAGTERGGTAIHYVLELRDSFMRRSQPVSDGANQVGPVTSKRDAGSQAKDPGISSAGKLRTKNSSDRPGSSPAARPSGKAREHKPDSPAPAPEQLTGSSEEVLPFGPLRRPASLSRPLSLQTLLRSRTQSFERMIANNREAPMTPPPTPLAHRHTI
jgi:hypothetical protein